MSDAIGRMKTHLSGCATYQTLKRKRKREKGDQEEDAQPTKKNSKQSTLDNGGAVIVRLSPEKIKKLDLLLATAIHRKGQPFNLLEGEDYDAFFKELCPAYKRPNEERIGSELLSMIYSCIHCYAILS